MKFTLAIPGSHPVIPQTLYFTSNGTFLVPVYNTLTVNLWGGGSGGGSWQSGNVNPQAGTASEFEDGIWNPTAGGGYNSAGGVATGGTTNLSGQSGGNNLPGGASPNGGAANGGYSTPGNFPGGGGAGQSTYTYGGSGGAFCQRIYSIFQLLPGTEIPFIVGVGGQHGGFYGNGGVGANGEIEIIIT